MARRALLVTWLLALAGACGPAASSTGAGHSGSIAIATDGARLYVASPDADSVSVLDVASHTLVREILLAPAHPVVDATTGAYTPAVMPRAVALSPDGATLYVTGERSGSLLVVDLAAGTVRATVAVGGGPIGVVLSADGGAAFVACSADATVVRVATATLTVVATAHVPPKPWALAWSPDGATLLVTHLLGPGVTALDPSSLAVHATWTIPATAARGDRRLAHGEVRGVYDVVARPGTKELWAAHLLLGTDTAQPELDFESTAFAALSVLHDDGRYEQTLSTDAPDVAGTDGAFADVVSGPHAVTFTRDGAYVLVVDQNSEDLLAVDARTRAQAALLRPLPGHMADGIVLSPDERFAYVLERSTNDVAIVALDRSGGSLGLTATGTIPVLAVDPMPADLRLGEHLFYSANSDEYPITKNHWVACASCHLEGASDAVTWRFAQGPRDTPSNAGGTRGTGFLFRTADRQRVQDYWRTINVEQGGRFDPSVPAQQRLLDALAAYVDDAIPLPPPPHTDAALVARGRAIFESPTVGCATCHTGPRFTDSGAGNPTLDFAGDVVLHDVGTCVSTPFADVAHVDIDDDARSACDFDTPSLSGIADSAPYLHDGSAATLRDVLEQTRGRMGNIEGLSHDDEDALVEYLRSL